MVPVQAGPRYPIPEGAHLDKGKIIVCGTCQGLNPINRDHQDGAAG